MYQDRYGLPLTTTSEAAAVAYREGLDRILYAWVDAGAVLEQAIAEDPGFALAYIARARVHQIYAETADARAKAKQARSLAAKLTKRERQHVEIIASAIEGQSADVPAVQLDSNLSDWTWRTDFSAEQRPVLLT
ncbi:MAG: hypothetical protein WCA54_05310 [Pseudolabrys sp.]